MNNSWLKNYTIAYYLIRLFSLGLLIDLGLRYRIYAPRPDSLYRPTVWLQRIFFPEFPEPGVYYGLLVLTALAIIASLIKPKPIFTFLVFVLLAICVLPVFFYHSGQHLTHVLLLYYFLSVFLIPQTLGPKDQKNIQWLYFGLLITYSWSGIYKWGSMLKDIVTQDPRIAWFEINALEINTYVNYYKSDIPVPKWIANLLAYPELLIVITLIGILLQSICFVGAFRIKWLAFFMIYLVLFHFFTQKFVLADFYIAQISVLILFFPYSYFLSKK